MFSEAVSKLFLHGANSKLKGHNGNDILHAAAESGDYDTLLNIIERDSDINTVNNTHDTALHLICAQVKLSDTKSILLLLENGASIEAR